MDEFEQKNIKYVRLSQPQHSDGKRLLEFWSACQMQGGLAMGRDIPSRPIAGLLSGIMVMEPSGNGEDFRIRLAGTALRRRWKVESTHLNFSDVFDPDGFESQLKLTNQVLATGEPLFLDITQYEPNAAPIRRETSILRILSPDMKKHWILVGIFYHS